MTGHGPSSDAWGRAGEMLEAAGGDPDRAAQELLDQLSTEELIAMVSGQRPIPTEVLANLKGEYNLVPYPAGSVPRLDFPGIRFADGPRGVVVGSSTAFPSSMARGATFDADLEREVGHAIGREANAQGANLFAGVCINLLRHPSWGRAQETYGEDPMLLGAMGAALTESAGGHVATCVKHFALNSMENSRFWVDVRVHEQDMTDIYLPHFKRCVDAGADSVMSAYNKVNGEWAGHHDRLLNQILKQDWGFSGFVMSDFGLGIRNMADALRGGQDLEMPVKLRSRRLPAAVAAGRVDLGRIRDAARRIATAVFRSAQRTGCETSPPSVVACDDHRQLAKRTAMSSAVLLRNEPVAGVPCLPLDVMGDGDRRPTIALIGKLADLPNTGDHGSSMVRSRHVVTVAEGMRSAAASHSTTLRESLNDSSTDAAHAALGADAAVVVVGTTWRDEGEFVGVWGGDRRSLRLSKHHEELIEAVARACPRTIVVLVGGSAFVTEQWRNQVGAILMTWYSGDEGGNAIAEVIMGDASPGGRLPCTWPASESQLPPYKRWTRRAEYGPLHGYRLFHATGRRPAFWFGEGLSYSTTEWADAALASGPDGSSVTVRVANTGGRPTTDVVQVYVNTPRGTYAPPLPTLAGFAKAELAPAEESVMTISLDADICEQARTRATPSHPATVWIGRSSNPDALHRCGELT